MWFFFPQEAITAYSKNVAASFIESENQHTFYRDKCKSYFSIKHWYRIKAERAPWGNELCHSQEKCPFINHIMLLGYITYIVQKKLSVKIIGSNNEIIQGF